MSLQESISSNLKETLTKMGKKQAWLAKETGIKPQNISAYIRGISVPDLSTICIIADKLGVSVDWLCGRSMESDSFQHKKTLGDIARDIVSCEEEGVGIYFDVVKRKETFFTDGLEGEPPECIDVEREYPAVAFVDSDLRDFFTDWRKIKALFDSETIDIELYQLWLEKHLSILDSIPAEYRLLGE